MVEIIKSIYKGECYCGTTVKCSEEDIFRAGLPICDMAYCFCPKCKQRVTVFKIGEE